ncbi:MAG: class I SAM-dependent methyltransferase [Armatimonadetes bacterium]|nr:class I SAM-dependent methyltransferase [Armatimonadota bacterium]
MLDQETRDYVGGGLQKDEYGADEVIEVACPLCGSNDKDLIYVEHGAIGISQCRPCRLIYASPRLKSPEQVYWGDAERYFEEARLIYAGKAASHRDPNYLEELDLIESFKPTGRFLDVGCNLGMLLRHAVKRNWTACGVEPSPSLFALARERLGLSVHNCFLHELDEGQVGKFDIIALSDVFEHICDPLAILGEVKRLLTDDGIVYIKVPNGNWNLFKQRLYGLMGRRPATLRRTSRWSRRCVDGDVA